MGKRPPLGRARVSIPRAIVARRPAVVRPPRGADIGDGPRTAGDVHLYRHAAIYLRRGDRSAQQRAADPRVHPGPPRKNADGVTAEQFDSDRVGPRGDARGAHQPWPVRTGASQLRARQPTGRRGDEGGLALPRAIRPGDPAGAKPATRGDRGGGEDGDDQLADQLGPRTEEAGAEEGARKAAQAGLRGLSARGSRPASDTRSDAATRRQRTDHGRRADRVVVRVFGARPTSRDPIGDRADADQRRGIARRDLGRLPLVRCRHRFGSGTSRRGHARRRGLG